MALGLGPNPVLGGRVEGESTTCGGRIVLEKGPWNTRTTDDGRNTWPRSDRPRHRRRRHMRRDGEMNAVTTENEQHMPSPLLQFRTALLTSLGTVKEPSKWCDESCAVRHVVYKPVGTNLSRIEGLLGLGEDSNSTELTGRLSHHCTTRLQKNTWTNNGRLGKMCVEQLSQRTQRRPTTGDRATVRGGVRKSTAAAHVSGERSVTNAYTLSPHGDTDWIHRQTHRQTDRQTDRLRDRQTASHGSNGITGHRETKDRQTDAQTDRRADRQVDSIAWVQRHYWTQTDKKTDRQTHRRTGGQSRMGPTALLDKTWTSTGADFFKNLEKVTPRMVTNYYTKKSDGETDGRTDGAGDRASEIGICFEMPTERLCRARTV
ncbi:unnamed protein product [Heligmosomoides polygyrus]|uniref:Uncharacterized protein n=1 Tax=Heligmosomoides polygyrus TaxID=6339 RepID=A0A3P8EEU1_HELPZ|nr:unnamed protein product [Heligmosomoides polygyrus]